MGELVHLRIDKKMKLGIQAAISNGLFGNMTEFIRDSIRKNIEDYERKNALIGLEKLRGRAKELSAEQKKAAKNELEKLPPSELFRKLGLD